MVVADFTVYILIGYAVVALIIEPLSRKIDKNNFIANMLYLLVSLSIWFSTTTYAKAIALIMMLAFIIKAVVDWAYSVK